MKDAPLKWWLLHKINGYIKLNSYEHSLSHFPEERAHIVVYTVSWGASGQVSL